MTSRSRVAAFLLTVDGVLVLALGILHLAVTPHLTAWLGHTLEAGALAAVRPPFLLNHLGLGIVLLPLGASFLVSGRGVRAGHRWAWVLALVDGLTLVALVVTLFSLMGSEYFSSAPFLAATVIATAVAVTALVPLVQAIAELRPRRSSQ